MEQALAQCVVPHLSANDMNLYVFSDTAIITSPQLDPLLAPISRLFSHFIELLGEGEDMSLELWMRAAISVGSVIHVDHLKNSERIRTIPFLDTSLPTVYKLEGLRKGSRVFIDPAIRDHAFEERKNTFFRWQQITGHGEFIANVTEFLWPAIAYSDEGRLARITQKLHHWWSESLNAKEWPKPEYFERMLHLDETVKLFIRASSLFCFGNCKTNLLFSFLPKHKGRRRNLTYQWGLWFQAMRGLVEECEADEAMIKDVLISFEVMKEVLRKGDYLQHFMKELEYPDYADFRRRLCWLGLHSGS